MPYLRHIEGFKLKIKPEIEYIITSINTTRDASYRFKNFERMWED